MYFFLDYNFGKRKESINAIYEKNTHMSTMLHVCTYPQLLCAFLTSIVGAIAKILRNQIYIERNEKNTSRGRFECGKKNTREPHGGERGLPVAGRGNDGEANGGAHGMDRDSAVARRGKLGVS